jgi:hypothetical protein
MINKNDILDKIYELKKNDKKLIDIFKLIHLNKIRYDKSFNGIYVDLNMIDNNILLNINEILNEE